MKFIDLLHRLGVEGAILIVFALLPCPKQGAATVAGLPSVCPFYQWTKHPCPGCGITRSLVSSAHGQFDAAFQFHALGPLVFLILCLIVLVRFFGKDIRQLPEPWISRIAWLGITLLLGTWLARLAGLLPPLP